MVSRLKQYCMITVVLVVLTMVTNIYFSRFVDWCVSAEPWQRLLLLKQHLFQVHPYHHQLERSRVPLFGKCLYRISTAIALLDSVEFGTTNGITEYNLGVPVEINAHIFFFFFYQECIIVLCLISKPFTLILFRLEIIKCDYEYSIQTHICRHLI